MNAPDYKDQIAAAFAEMKRRLLPAVLAHNDSNVIVIGNFILKRGLSGTSVDDLLFAVSELDQKELITWQTPPVAPAPAPKKTDLQIQQEWDEKERQRIQKERQENAKPFDVAKRTASAEKLAQLQKAQTDAKVTIDHLINMWSVSAGPNRIDEAKSDAGRKALASIKIARGTLRDSVLELKIIQRLFHSDSVEQILAEKDAVIAAVLAEANGTQDPKIAAAQRAEQRRQERGGVGSAAHLPQYK